MRVDKTHIDVINHIQSIEHEEGLRSLHLLSTYDFTECAKLTPKERVIRCSNGIRLFHESRDYQDIDGIPCLPPIGATQEEIQALELTIGTSLPEDYKILLRHHRYIEYNQEVSVYGFNYQGMRICGSPFIIDNLFTSGRFLVVGDYWCFADGDQLLVALHEQYQPVYGYFHEHGPRIEYFAPDVTSALWRIVFERE